MGQGDQLVEIAQTGLVLCQQNHVAWALAALHRRAQLEHCAVDLTDPLNFQVRQHPPEGNQHISHHRSVIAGPVMVEGGQTQVLRHNIQLVLAQIGQQVLSEDQRVNGRVCKGPAHSAAALRQKAHIKLGIVGGQRTVPYPVQKVRQRLLLARCVRHHGIGDSR